MADKEVRIDFERIRDPDKVTEVNVQEFKKRGLDIHRHDVIELIDDHSRKVRVLKIRDRKYFDLGRGKK